MDDKLNRGFSRLTSTIYLIVEDKTDGEVVKTIIRKRSIPVRIEVRFPSGGSGGISRLAAQLERLIETAKAEKTKHDCVTVLHDLDIHQQQINRQSYEHIEKTCRDKGVKLVIAHDEIESWLLADSAMCGWLKIEPRSWDNERKPKRALIRLLKKEKGINYESPARKKVFDHLDGTGDRFSQSMQDAVKKLYDAPCMKS